MDKPKANMFATQFDRRDILASIGIACLVGISAPGCDLLSTDPGQQANEGGAHKPRLKEAPTLAEQVKSGDLPPVEERLPENPLVVEPVEQIGAYGGEWRMVIPAPGPWLPSTTMAYDPLVRWEPQPTAFSAEEVIPNIAERFEFNDEGSEFTFYLRRGIRWSDGELFTAEDIMFWYEDVLKNEELTPAPPSWLGLGEDAVTVELVDDHTVRFVFAKPNALFLHHLAGLHGAPITNHPAHYLRQFHPKYEPAAEQRAKEANLDRWVDLFYRQASWSENAEKPVLHAWQMTQPLGAATQVVAERNPYYWKTDPDGNQLPYIDRVTYTIINDIETMVLKAANGEVDMQQWLITRLQDKPLYARNREDGDFHFFETKPDQMNYAIIALNLTHKDSVLREVFSSKDFRIGLSHAINRQEIVDVVFQRQGEAWQAAPRPETPFYDEEFAKQYTDYDVDLANEFLDQAGYSERDGNGMRLGPDAKPIVFGLAMRSDVVEFADVSELVQDYWREVGVEVSLQPEDLSLFGVRSAANEHDAVTHLGTGGVHAHLVTGWYAPVNTTGGGNNVGVLWLDWYLSGGERGEEPPETVKQQMDLYDRLIVTMSTEEQQALMRDILEIAKEQFFAIGTVLMANEYGIVRNDFRNVPEVIWKSAPYPSPAPTNCEQYFWTAGAATS